MIKFTAEIKPVSLSRPKVNTYTKTAFYPAKDKHFRNDLGLIAKSAMKGRQPLTGALKVRVDLYKNISACAKNFGDIDNHQKSIFDALNGICFIDDSQIVEVHCYKHKSKLEKIEIEIEELVQRGDF